jgi:hypothetical protein
MSAMSMGTGADSQLRTIGWLHSLLSEEGIDYWLFGGWAVDFHARRVTRDHIDIDVAVWAADRQQITSLLEAAGWIHAPEPAEDGYTGFERGDTRLELAFLARDDAGTIYTPLTEGRGDWPAGSFGDARSDVDGVVARVVELTSLIEDKSAPRLDPAVAAKDRADVAVLASIAHIG